MKSPLRSLLTHPLPLPHANYQRRHHIPASGVAFTRARSASGAGRYTITIPLPQYSFLEERAYDLLELSLRSLSKEIPHSDEKIFLGLTDLVARALIARGVHDLSTAIPLFRQYTIPSGRLTAPTVIVLHWRPDYDPNDSEFHSVVERDSTSPSIRYVNRRLDLI